MPVLQPGVSRRHFLRLAGGLTGAALVAPALAACGSLGAAPTPTPKRAAGKTKVAFMYVAAVGDIGWNWAHDQGRLALERNVPGVQTTFVEAVSEEPAIATAAIRELAQKGNQIIITTSFGYMDPTIAVAKEFPKTTFIHVSGYKTAPNVGTAFGKIEEPRYVSGLVAGKMTKTNQIGYVAAFPIPEVLRGINAFTLGVRKSNPAARVKVSWSNTWFDPAKEGQIAGALLDGGADIIAQHQDTTKPQEAAQSRGKLGVGYDADMAKLAPQAVITSPVWYWGVYYTELVKQVQAGTWQPNAYWGSWKDGVVDLAPWGAMVPPDIQKFGNDTIAQFKAGTQSIYTIFSGPINDQNGTPKVTANTPMTDAQLLGMDWLVEGVDGTLPKA